MTKAPSPPSPRILDFVRDPAFKMLVFGSLSAATGIAYGVCLALQYWVQEAVWVSWLGFLTAGWGVTAWDYRTKRTTAVEIAGPDAPKKRTAEPDARTDDESGA